MAEKVYVIMSECKPILVTKTLNCNRVNIEIDKCMNIINIEETKHSVFPQNDRYYEVALDKNKFGEGVLRVFYSRARNMYHKFRYYELYVEE